MEGYLATVCPPLRRVHLPISRDRAMFLLVALNELMLGLESFLAHAVSGTIRPNELIPIVFGPVAAVLLVIAVSIAGRRRAAGRWRVAGATISVATLLASVLVGLLGTGFHLVRALMPAAPRGAQLSILRLIWSPPLLAPLFFALVGVLGLAAAWPERGLESGMLVLPAGRRLRLPCSKTRLYFLLASLGILTADVSSVLDHARTDFSNPWLWVATGVGTFGAVVALTLALIARPARSDLTTYTVAMLGLIVTGLLGFYLHVRTDLLESTVLVLERFIRQAPIVAPMSFANAALIGLLALLDP